MKREKKQREKERDKQHSKNIKTLESRGVDNPEQFIFLSNLEFFLIIFSPLFIIFTWPFGQINWLAGFLEIYFEIDKDIQTWYNVSVIIILYGLEFLLIWASEKGAFGDTDPNTSLGVSKSSMIGMLVRWALLIVYTIAIVINYFFSNIFTEKPVVDTEKTRPYLENNMPDNSISSIPKYHSDSVISANISDQNNMDKSYTQNIFSYTINDPDGFSNLRVSPFGEIIRKVFDNENFAIIDTIDQHCKVSFADSSIGFIHISRIKTK